jgi:hypothetical protein
MIKLEEQEIDTNIPHRRRGNAFDTLANVFRNVKDLIFVNSFMMRNRPGFKVTEGSQSSGIVNVKNMFEAHYTEKAVDGINAIVLGRKGDGTSRDTQMIELAAGHSEVIGANRVGRLNGSVRLRVTSTTEDPEADNTGVTVFHPGSIIDNASGVACHVVGHGSQGGVVITWKANRGDNPNTGRRILVSSEDIDIIGGLTLTDLPTSATGLSVGQVYRSGNDLKIVT